MVFGDTIHQAPGRTRCTVEPCLVRPWDEKLGRHGDTLFVVTDTPCWSPHELARDAIEIAERLKLGQD